MARAPDPVEARLLRELEGIEIRMNALRSEKEAIERVLVSVRRSNPMTIQMDVTRKNSIKRLLIESIVIEYLNKSKVLTSTHQLFVDVKRIDRELKANTFRSTLHRMKDRGLISNPREGKWSISIASELAQK